MGALYVEPIEPRHFGPSLEWSRVTFRGRVNLDPTPEGAWVLLVSVLATLHEDDRDVFPAIRSVRAAEPVMFGGETYIGVGEDVLGRLAPRQVRELEDAALRAAEGR